MVQITSKEAQQLRRHAKFYFKNVIGIKDDLIWLSWFRPYGKSFIKALRPKNLQRTYYAPNDLFY